MEALDARVEQVLGSITSDNTKYVYLRTLSRFIEWLYENTEADRRQVLFTSTFRELGAING